MKLKNLIILGVILAVLIGLSFIKKIAKNNVPANEGLTNIISQPVQKEKVTQCVISLNGKKTKLVKKGGIWTVENYHNAYADKEKVSQLLDKLSDLKGEMRSDAKELLADYSITDEQGISISLKQQDSAIAEIVIGADSLGTNMNFIRRKGSNKVYAVEENFLPFLGFWGTAAKESFKTDWWIERNLVHIKEDEIKSIMLENDGITYAGLSKENNKWKTLKEYGVEVNQNKVNNFIKEVIDLKASSVISLEEAEQYEKEEWKIVVGLDSGEKVSIVAKTDKEGNDYYVKTSDKEYGFKMYKYAFKNIDKKDSDFFTDNPLKIKEEKAVKITINDKENKSGLSLIKHSVEKEKNIWKTERGDVFDSKDVKELLIKFKNIKLTTLHKKVSGGKRIFSFDFKNEDGITSSYKITEKTVAEDGEKDKKYYLKVKNEKYLYKLEEEFVATLKNILNKLYGSKTAVGEEKDKVLDKSVDKEKKEHKQ